MKYSTEQNIDHWIQALAAAYYGDNFGPPSDCPASRWKSLVREAKLSIPSLETAVNKHIRSRTRKGKFIESVAR